MEVWGAVATGDQLVGTCYSFQKRLLQLPVEKLNTPYCPQPDSEAAT